MHLSLNLFDKNTPLTFCECMEHSLDRHYRNVCRQCTRILLIKCKASFQVVYVTATIPYLFLIIMLIKGLTLDGSVDGIRQFLAPDFSRLMSVQVINVSFWY